MKKQIGNEWVVKEWVVKVQAKGMRGERMGDDIVRDDIGDNQKISGVVYLGSEEHNKNGTISMFGVSNPLHPDLFHALEIWKLILSIWLVPPPPPPPLCLGWLLT